MQKQPEFAPYQTINNSYSQVIDVLTKLQTPKSVLNDGAGSENDKSDSEHLLALLEQQFRYDDTQEQKTTKEEAVTKVKGIIQKWIRSTARKVGFSDQDIEKVGGDLYVFGSYKLKANCQDSDIDSVCVVPAFINREYHFF